MNHGENQNAGSWKLFLRYVMIALACQSVTRVWVGLVEYELEEAIVPNPGSYNYSSFV
jgi:hypothetical protein